MGLRTVLKKACNHVNDMYHDYTLTPKKRLGNSKT